jgi:hypothetical protein
LENRADGTYNLGGARFYDEQKHDRGWATRVTRLIRAIDGPMTLNVTTTESHLAAPLGVLHSRQPTRTAGVRTGG